MSRILLVGREGNGKYSCVETIEKTSGIEHEITAEKCFGVGDIGKDLNEDIKTVIDNVSTKINSPGSIAAIVFVLKYGVRFTKQEKDAVEVVKLMFGQDVFSKYGVILMTYGDQFETDNDHSSYRTFMDWCRRQTGDIKTLFEEVNNRIILFDNKTNDTTRQRQQCNTLYSIVSDMDVKYGIKEFETAKPHHKILIENHRSLKYEKNLLREILPIFLGITTWTTIFMILIRFLIKEYFISALGIALTIFVIVWVFFGCILIYKRDTILDHLNLS